MARLFLFFFLLSCSGQAMAQWNNLRQKTLKTATLLIMDSLSIVPGSFRIYGWGENEYRLDPLTSRLELLRNPLPDSIRIRYRVFDIAFTQPVRKYSFDSAMNRYKVTESNVLNPPGKIFNFGNLQYNGAFGRSLSFGNNQDAVFNSQLNMQLSGYIGDSIYLSAAIADNNLPVQPDGTTQQLNEFDRILLSFSKKGYQLSLGDVDLRQSDDYFLSFYKRLQGISYQHQVSAGRNIRWKALVSGAVAKGKFARNVFQGIEGNQGPYRLQGTNGELFFVVLANTERVFIDGEKMQRGEDADYTINYNTAEITFMPRRMINKDRRIQVEFEYADRNYLNSLLYSRQEIQAGSHTRFSVALYRNNDVAGSPINQSLDNSQKLFLSGLGDSINRAFYPIAARDSFSTGSILYKKIPSPSGIPGDSIFVYSTSADSAFFRLNFVFTGDNQGNYIPLLNGANGRVYQWVPPVNGIPQGSFEPATFLVTPKKRQVISTHLYHRWNSFLSTTIELAGSRYDANAFSSKDKRNDNDLAGRIGTQYQRPVIMGTQKYSLMTGGFYEWSGASFVTVERLRSPEFYRNWGLDLLPIATSEKLPSAFVQLENESQKQRFQAEWQQYRRGDGFTGNRITGKTDWIGNSWQVKALWEQTGIRRPQVTGQFLRPSASLEKTFTRLRNISAGAGYSLERNIQRTISGDSLLPLSFQFYVINAFLKTDQRKPSQWQFSYYTRADKLPLGKQLVSTDQSHNYTLQTTLAYSAQRQFRLQATYRTLNVKQTTTSGSLPDKSLIGRAEYQFNEVRGFISGNLLYELGSGQEQRRDISYAEVPTGRGEYTWIDYNSDGIPQLNEFELARFADQAKYIRIFTPTNSFVKTGFAGLNYSIQFQPRALLSNTNAASAYQKILQRFHFQSVMQAQARQVAGNRFQVNPWARNISDSSLIGLLLNASQTLSYNRFSPVWGIDLLQSSNYGQQLLTYGAESRRSTDWQLRVRYTFLRQWTTDLTAKKLQRALSTPAFANRNYRTDGYTAGPRITYVYGSKWRVLAGYEYGDQQNFLAGAERSVSHTFHMETRWNVINTTSLLGKFSLNQLRYEGDANNTVAFLLLNGLQPGRNLILGVELTRRFAGNLELTVQYDGRKPGDVPFIHRGTASLKAIL